MKKKRKDSTGSILYTGESERISNGKKLGYVFRYKDSHGRACQIYAKTLSELRDKEEQVEKDEAEGISQASKKLTLQDVAERWFEYRRTDIDHGLRASTLDSYMYRWNIFFSGSELAKSTISSIKNKDITEHYRKMLADGMSPGTIETAHVVISGIFKYATSHELISFDPSVRAASSVVSRGKSAQKAQFGRVARCLDSEARAYLLQVLNEATVPTIRHYAPIIRFMLHSGLRIGEVAGLTFDDVRNGCVSVQRCLKYASDATGHMHMFINPPKSPSSRRTIRLSKAALADLEAWKALNVTCEVTVDDVSGFIFCTPKGRPMTYRALNKVLAQLSASSGGVLPRRFTSHYLRHTFVCDFVDSGAPITAVSRYVGHETADITLRVYYSCRDSVIEAAVDKLDEQAA